MHALDVIIELASAVQEDSDSWTNPIPATWCGSCYYFVHLVPNYLTPDNFVLQLCHQLLQMGKR